MPNSSQKLTLYVDGACRGNPGGVGGWGALIIDENNQHRECFGGELDTTNNRMELTAAIEGILACEPQHQLTIYTDSTYVQKGITEWIIGWKKKNWKDVKNPDLWKKLDQTCQNRTIDWHWIKGHAGHEGNERADQLANLGADQTAEEANSKKKMVPLTELANDWLLDDPFGLDTESELEEHELEAELDETEIKEASRTNQIPENPSLHNQTNEDQTNEDQENLVEITNSELVMPLATDIQQNEPVMQVVQADTKAHTNIHPAIKITPVSNPQEGERLLILDTETTGFYYQDTDRVIEIGAIEMINRRLTGSSIHIYINPKKLVGESENIHGISDDFLKDKPVFKEISAVLFDYLKGAEIVAHNANFDMNFLNMEFEKSGFSKLSEVCTVTDTLAVAKRKYPGQKNSLDALVRRLEIPQRDRTFHGALLDAEILADVYLAMTGGQVKLDIDHSEHDDEHALQLANQTMQLIDIPLVQPNQQELDAHQAWLKKYQEKNGTASLFEQYISM